MINLFMAQQKVAKPTVIDNPEAIEVIVIDLFSGAGGTKKGFENARNSKGEKIAIVIAGINHNYNALSTSATNCPDTHFYLEDISEMYGSVLHGMHFKSPQIMHLSRLTNIYRALYPNAKVILWASAPCTHYTNVRGTKPVDEKIRTLVEHLDRYIDVLDPDYIQIENVVEFKSWGPLCQDGRPISRKNGRDWLRWVNHINSLGYRDEWREMNSADYGAYTSRNRLFGCFTKLDKPIIWPKATHSKHGNESTGLFSDELKKWEPVEKVIDFTNLGKSVFTRKTRLKERTIRTIVGGIKRHISTGEVDPKDSKIHLLLRPFKTGYTQKLDQPIGAIPTVPKADLLSFILNPTYGGHTTSTKRPCPVVVARQDKAPLYIVYLEKGELGFDIYSFLDESEIEFINNPVGEIPIRVELLLLMVEYKISNIFMRQLSIDELKVIQGFPKDYILIGTQKDQGMQLGNIVHPIVTQKWAEAMAEKLAS